MADAGKRSKSGGILIPAILITVIAVGGGGLFGTLVLVEKAADGAVETNVNGHKKSRNKKGGDGNKNSHDRVDDHAAKAGEVSATEMIYPLAPIVTNLNSTGKNWVRLEASIIAKPGSELINEVTLQRLGQDLIGHLRQLTIGELEGAAGLMNLRSDLGEIVRLRTKARSEEIVVHGMIVE